MVRKSVAPRLSALSVLFSVDALSRRESGRTLAAAAAAALLLLSPSVSSAQQVPPTSESVVVTATSTPEDEKDVGSAITVITSWAPFQNVATAEPSGVPSWRETAHPTTSST